MSRFGYAGLVPPILALFYRSGDTVKGHCIRRPSWLKPSSLPSCRPLFPATVDLFSCTVHAVAPYLLLGRSLPVRRYPKKQSE